MAAAAKQQLIQNYIKDLKQFLRVRGGSEISSHFAGFHANHKKHRELVPDLKVFCDAHPEHFAVSSPTKGPWTVSLNDKDWKAVLALRNFILTRGGMLQSQDFPDLKQHHPKAAAWIYSGGRSLREFCQIHEEIFIVESSNSSPSVRIRLRPEATRATDRPNADGALTEAEVVADLMQFIEANGGCVTSNMFGAFFSSRPRHRAAAPKLRDFFEKYPKHFHINDECSGPHWTVSLAKSKHQASNADGALTEAEVVADLMQFIEANGGCVTSNMFGAFFSSRPRHRAAAPKLRDFFEKYPKHFHINDECSGPHWTVSLAKSKHQASNADGALTEAEVVADLMQFIEANCGCVTSNMFGAFFSSRPRHRAAAPKLRDFFEKYPKHFHINDECSGPHWTVSLAKSKHQASNADGALTEAEVVADLMQFIEANGGCVTSNKFASFFSSRPKHRAAAPKLRNFFEKHPQHFHINDECSGPHWTVSLAKSKHQASNADGALTEAEVVADLMQFIEANGGCVTSNMFASFFSSRPKHRAAAPKLRNFFEKHPQHFHINDECSGPHWTVSLAKSKHQASNADGALTEAEVVADLMQFIEANGGCVTSNMFASFFSSRPKHRAAAPKLRNFFEKHPQHFHINDECSGPHWTVSLAKSKHQASNADGALTEAEVVADLLQFIEANGGCVTSNKFASFFSSRPKHRAAAPKLRNFLEKHPQHFHISDECGGPHWTVSLAKSKHQASNADGALTEAEVVADLMRFIEANGGCVTSNKFASFFSSRPKHRAAARKLRDFFEKHPQHFCISDEGNNQHWTVSLAKSKHQASIADGALTEAEVVADLMQFIEANGGCVTSNKFASFFSSRPKHRAAARKLRDFFEKHPQHFCISDEGNNQHWTVSLAKSKHQASIADGALTEAEVVADLMQFIEANGGCVTSNKFASFFSSRPKHRAAARKLQNFFEKYPLHFCISDEGNNQHWKVSLGTDNRAVARKIMSSLYQRLFADKSHSAQQALKVDGDLTEGQVAADLVNLVQAAGGSMLFNEFTLFFKSRPQHRAAVPRLRQFFERHTELFRILDEGNSAVWKVLLVNCSNGADISGSTDTTPTVSLSPTGTESVKQSKETCVQKLVERRLSEDPWSNGEDPWRNSLVRAELPHLKTNQHTSASKEGKEKQDNRSSTHEEDPWAGGRDPWSEHVLVSSGTVTSSAEGRKQDLEIPSWPRGSDPAGLPSACLSERMGKENADPWANGQDPWSAHLRSPKSVDSEQVKMVEGTPAAWADWRDPRSRSFPLGQPTAPADMQPASITVQHATPSAGYSPCTQLPYSAYESGESSNKATAWQSDENCFKRGELRSSPDALPAAPAASAAPAPQPWIYSQASLDETSAQRILQPSPHGGEGRRYGSHSGLVAMCFLSR